jgi:hypothetical protein
LPDEPFDGVAGCSVGPEDLYHFMIQILSFRMQSKK